MSTPTRDELRAAYAKLLFDDVPSEKLTMLLKRIDPRTFQPHGWDAVRAFTGHIITTAEAAAGILPWCLDALVVIDRALRSQVYLGGAAPCVADVVIYLAARPAVAAMDERQRWALCSVSRWVDQMQHLVLGSADERAMPPPPAGMPPPLRISFNYDMPDTPVPLVLRRPDGSLVSLEGSVVEPSSAATGGGSAAGPPPPADGGADGADEKKLTNRKEKNKEKKEKKEKAAPPKPAEPAAAEQSPISRIDIRVGVVLEAERHPEADSLYVEKIDLGEGAPRTVVSGLVNFVPIEKLRGAKVVVVCNLKPANMKGVESAGMVLCASSADKSAVELVRPPAACAAGERVTFDGHPGEPEANPNAVKKKKMFEAVAGGLKTNAQKVATWEGVPFGTAHGACTVDSLADAAIK